MGLGTGRNSLVCNHDEIENVSWNSARPAVSNVAPILSFGLIFSLLHIVLFSRGRVSFFVLLIAFRSLFHQISGFRFESLSSGFHSSSVFRSVSRSIIFCPSPGLFLVLSSFFHFSSPSLRFRDAWPGSEYRFLLIVSTPTIVESYKHTSLGLQFSKIGIKFVATSLVLF